MRVGGRPHAPAALPPGKESQYKFCRRLGGPQGRYGWVPKIWPPNRDSIPRTVQPVAFRGKVTFEKKNTQLRDRVTGSEFENLHLTVRLKKLPREI